MEEKESTKLNNLLCQLVQDTRDDERPLIFEDMLEITKLFEDHLNTQPQAEEKTVCEGCGKTITSRFMQSYTKGDGMHSYCLSCDPEKQDTPEEWEERFVKRFGYFSSEIDFIKDLLLERERWAIDTFLKDTASYNSFHNGRPRTMRNGLSGEGFEVRVSKLNKKK